MSLGFDSTLCKYSLIGSSPNILKINLILQCEKEGKVGEVNCDEKGVTKEVLI